MKKFNALDVLKPKYVFIISPTAYILRVKKHAENATSFLVKGWIVYLKDRKGSILSVLKNAQKMNTINFVKHSSGRNKYSRKFNEIKTGEFSFNNANSTKLPDYFSELNRFH